MSKPKRDDKDERKPTKDAVQSYPPPHPHLNDATDPGSIEVRRQS